MKNSYIKTIIGAFIFCLGVTPAFAQIEPKVNPDDVKSIDAIIGALYEVVSGPKEERRDWARMKGLFGEEGRLIPSGANGYNVMSVDDYSVMGDRTFSTIDFFEVENSRIVERFGSIAHVFSTYESRNDLSDATPFARGINSIQLRFDGTRWWIITVFWQSENDELPLPDKYLK